MNSNKGLLYSLIAHIVLALGMVLQVIFYPSEALDLSRAIRVDMVDLPDKIDLQQPEEKKPEPAAEVKPEEKSIEKPVVKEDPKKLPEKKEKADTEVVSISKAKQKQKEALAKLKGASAVDKIKKELEEDRAKEQEAQRSKQVFKGRVLSAGSALTGLDKLQSDSYLSQLDRKIKSQWALPQWLIGKSLRTRVHIRFDADGTILSKKITQSSGNPTYDEYCLLAIDRAAPLPPVPEKFSVVYKMDGIVIGFPD